MALSNDLTVLTVNYRRHRHDYTGQRLQITADFDNEPRKRTVLGIDIDDEDNEDNDYEIEPAKRWGEGETRIVEMVKRKGGLVRTAWGVVYRVIVGELEEESNVCFKVGILGTAGSLEDEWDVKNVGGNGQEKVVWLLQGCPVVASGLEDFVMSKQPVHPTDIRVHVDESLSRFIGVLVENESSDAQTNANSRQPLLVTRDAAGSRVDVFPGDLFSCNAFPNLSDTNGPEQLHGDSYLFLLDRGHYQSLPISLNFSSQNNATLESITTAHYTGNMGNLTVFSCRGGGGNLKSLAAPIMFSKLIMRSLSPNSFSSVRILSDKKIEHRKKAPPLVPKGSNERRRLVIHYKRFANDYANIGLVASSLSAPAFVAITKSEGVFNASSVFSIDLTTVPPPALRDGISITAVWNNSGLPLGDEAIYHMADHELGVDLLMRQGEFKLLPLTVVSAKLYYHRYGSFDDYEQWQVTVWDAGDKFGKIHLSACRKLHGSAQFDLSSLHFPRGTTVHFQPTKVHKYTSATCGDKGPEPFPKPSVVVVSDIVRTVRSEDLAGDIHCWQGSSRLTYRRPSKDAALKKERGGSLKEIQALRQSMENHRYLSVRYRRHVEDYSDWDLWVWDASDPNSKGHGIPPLNELSKKNQGNELDFSIDRALFGSGTDIRIIGRHGGDKWLAKDDPARRWHPPSEISMQYADIEKQTVGGEKLAVCMVEGFPELLHSFDAAREWLVAYTNGDRTIILELPVPLEWVSEVLKVKVHMCERDISKLDTQQRSQLKGKPLDVREVQRTHLTEVRVTLRDGEDYIDEDFPVEKVLVCLSGFHPVALRWQEYDNLDDYYYPGRLGYAYEKSATTFRLFAPTASLVSVVVYEHATGEEKTVYPMRKIPQGCWKAIVQRDLNGRYYKLLAVGEDKRLFPGVEVIDPYSRCNTSHIGRGLIFSGDKISMAASPNILLNQLIIYELHVRDISIDENSGVLKQYRGKFLGLAQRGTNISPPTRRKEPNLLEWRGLSSTSPLSTCLDHIIEMGVNAVQLQPIQDFDNDEESESEYNWGYMPVHYNSPDGWYATGEKASTARVTELKVLVNALHEAGLKVIMDVVYNHTAEDPNEFNPQARFSFNGLVPRYYYRTCANVERSFNGQSTCIRKGSNEQNCGCCYSNGSGCGNEFRSEAPMARKFLIDSLRYWVTEFKIDGFRFDLAGLMDQETLGLLASELPGTILYGEPWAGGTTPIEISSKGVQRSKGFGFFNNEFRDALRGSPFSVDDCFLMDGSRIDEVKEGILGSLNTWTDVPQESINYIECHDNRTLYDHMVDYRSRRSDDIEISEQDLIRIQKLGAVVIFTSQGIPLIQAGQEMMRTKFGVENSYKSPDYINKIRWSSKLHRLPVVKYYQGLIQLRREHPELFALRSGGEVRSQVAFFEDLGLAVPARCISYQITSNIDATITRLRREGRSKEEAVESARRWHRVVVLLNPGPTEVTFVLPGAEQDIPWIKIVDGASAGIQELRGVAIGKINVEGRSGTIMRSASPLEREKARLEIRLASITDAYAVPFGDDGLTEYTVGIGSARTATEKEAYSRLVAQRERFFETTE